jgi:orotate phosphoribosyltransferase
MPSEAPLTFGAIERDALAEMIVKRCYLTGHFKLRSGQESQYYWDKYRFESDPVVLRAVAQHLLRRIPADVEVFAGLELGGIPIATSMGIFGSKPIAFVRKARKTYGTCNIVEGSAMDGKSVCVVEDVITTGGQALESLREIRAEGAKVKHVACVILRGKDLRPFEDAGVEVIPLFTGAELEDVRARA